MQYYQEGCGTEWTLLDLPAEDGWGCWEEPALWSTWVGGELDLQAGQLSISTPTPWHEERGATWCFPPRRKSWGNGTVLLTSWA